MTMYSREEMQRNPLYQTQKQVQEIMDKRMDFQDKIDAAKREKRNGRLTLWTFFLTAAGVMIAIITILK